MAVGSVGIQDTTPPGHGDHYDFQIRPDTGWKTGGVGAEITTLVAEKGLEYLKAPVKRVASLDIPTPASDVLEAEFYSSKADIVVACLEMLDKKGTK